MLPASVGERNVCLTMAPIALILTLPIVFWLSSKADCNTTGLTQWLPDSDGERDVYDWFRATFRSDESTLVTWAGCTLESLAPQQFADALMEADRSRHQRIFRAAISGTQVVEELTSSPLNLPKDEAVKRLSGVLTSDTKLKSGDDAPHTFVLVQLTPHGLQQQRSAIQAIREAARESCGITAKELRIGGRVYEAAMMDEKSQQTLRNYVLPITIVSLLLAWATIRSLRALFVVVIVATYCRLLTLGLIYLSGVHLTAVLIIAPLLVYVLSVSAAMHFTNHFLRHHSDSPSAWNSARFALKAVWRPCALAAFTTVLGLISLNVSHIAPIREFGQFATLGVLAALPIVLFCMPGGLAMVVGHHKRKARGHQQKRLSDLAHSVQKHRRGIVIGFSLAIAGCGLGITWLRTTISFNGMFAADSEINRNYRWMEQNVGGLGSVEAVLQFPNTSKRAMPLRVGIVREIEKSLHTIPDVSGILSAATFRPGDDASGYQRLLQATMIRRHLPATLRQWDLITSDDEYEYWRMHIRVSALRDGGYAELLQQIRTGINTAFVDPDDLSSGSAVTLTGLIAVIEVSTNTLLTDLLYSYLCAFLMICAVMTFMLRSFRAGLLAMLVNTAPTIIVFGIMGWMDYKVDIASVLTASVALGVSLDDTLHFLSWFRREVAAGVSKHDAIYSACKHCGPAMIQTTLVCGLGLIVLVHSDFIPTRRFALLQCLLLATALVGDLILLPAILGSRYGDLFIRKQLPTESCKPAPAAA